MAESLMLQHPDCVKISNKWGRQRHVVDYSFFKSNKLIKKEGLKVKQGINNYNME